MNELTKYLIGQRVIHKDNEIVTIIRPPVGFVNIPGKVWAQGHRNHTALIDLENIKPLPGGQL